MVNISQIRQTYSYDPSGFAKSYDAFRKTILNNEDKDTDVTTIRGKILQQGRSIKVASVQLETTSGKDTGDEVENDAASFFNRAVEAVHDAVTNHNANLVLLQELFLGPYFCQSQEASLFSLAENIDEGNPIILKLQSLAKSLNVVLPISIFERKNNTFYNTVIMIDSDGSNLGKYRKTHIPDGTGYQEKFYFSPGDTGFKVFDTRIGKVGVGICWDQWFPEAARSMALLGADILLYPTAIGSEPQDPTLNSADHWQRVMQGHAAANMVPVVASNRYGTEILLDEAGKEKQRIRFYGRSFITDAAGAIVKEAKDGTDIIAVEMDFEANRSCRAAWGLFRDRRPELYEILRTKDGETKM